LHIRAIRVGETVRFYVSDSGFGMAQEEADEINRVIRSQVIKESDHIGLSNVHQRINLMFGDQYGVTVRSKINEGTTVELTIPYLQ
jgi:two-component system sensor histidine kinase YesM